MLVLGVVLLEVGCASPLPEHEDDGTGSEDSSGITGAEVDTDATDSGDVYLY